MENALLIQHFREEQENFHFYLERTRRFQDMEDIHQLRVSIKKLRAIWSLAHRANREKFSHEEFLSLISGLFRSAGVVRDMQVVLEMVEKMNAAYLALFASYLRTSEELARKDLAAITEAFDSAKLAALENGLLAAMREIPDDAVMKYSAAYIIKQSRKVERLSEALPDEDTLHKIRKQLKIVSEVLSIMCRVNNSKDLVKLQQHVRTLNQRIGTWHDHYVLLVHLNKFTAQSDLGRATRLMESLARRLGAAQEAREQKINSFIHLYLSHDRLKQLKNSI